VFFFSHIDSTKKWKKVYVPYLNLINTQKQISEALNADKRGHSEIVRLLLHDYCCQRHLRDDQGLTAKKTQPSLFD